jgi:hypothetical protein
MRAALVSDVDHVCVGVCAAHEGRMPLAAVAGPGVAALVHTSLMDDIDHNTVGVCATKQGHAPRGSEARTFAAPRKSTKPRTRARHFQ